MPDDTPADRQADDDLDADVEQCVRSVKADNPEMDKSNAIAICKDMQNRGVLEAYNDADPDHELVALAEFRSPGRIQRIKEDSGSVRYKNICLLAPGIWTDAGSRQTIEYAGEAIRTSADDWVDRTVNLLHGPALHNAEVLGEIGELPEDSFVVDDQDRLFGDIVLHGESPASELAIELMDEVLEAAEDPGKETPPVGPSVEIADDETRFDEERGLEVMTSMTFAGLGIVFGPASKPVEMESQVQERAVAMSDVAGADDTAEGDGPEGEFATVRTLDAGDDGETAGGGADAEEGTQSLKTGARPAGLMPGERDRLERLLEDLEETKAELEELLQSEEEMAMVQDLIAQYQQDGNDPSETTVADFLNWADGQDGTDMDVLEDVLDAFMQTTSGSSPDAVSVEALGDWLEETAGSTQDEEDGEGEGDDEAMAGDELREAVDTISEYASELETVKDMLADAEAAREEREDRIAELERRLSDLEDEPNQRSLAEPSDTEFVDGDESGEADGEHEDAPIL